MTLNAKSQQFAQMVGNNIRAERNRRRMSQDDLAKELNVSLASVIVWENGKNRMSLDAARRIADVFNISLDDLVGRNHETIQG